MASRHCSGADRGWIKVTRIGHRHDRITPKGGIPRPPCRLQPHRPNCGPHCLGASTPAGWPDTATTRYAHQIESDAAVLHASVLDQRGTGTHSRDRQPRALRAPSAWKPEASAALRHAGRKRTAVRPTNSDAERNRFRPQPLKLSYTLPMLEYMSDAASTTPHSENPLLVRLAHQLVDESAYELQTGDGESIEFWFISAAAATVVASARRFEVRAGLELTWRTQLDGRPIVTTLVVEEATYRSQRRAQVKLTLTGARTESRQRRHARRVLAAKATLTAVNCSGIVDGDWIPATLTDVSDSGVGLTTADTRPRSGDRFRLHVYLVHARLETELRVTRVSKRRHGDAYLGCSLISDSADGAEQLRAILKRLDGAHEAAA